MHAAERTSRGLHALLALAAAVACSPAGQGGEPEPPTIDVPPPLVVETADDPRAEEPAAALVGVLPSDFPADLPLHLPASLIDFGPTARGLRSVSLLSPHGVPRVRSGLEERLRQQGWAVAAGGSGADLELRKGGRQVWLRVENARPGTLYRYEY